MDDVPTSAPPCRVRAESAPSDLGHTLDAPLGNQIIQQFQLRLGSNGATVTVQTGTTGCKKSN